MRFYDPGNRHNNNKLTWLDNLFSSPVLFLVRVWMSFDWAQVGLSLELHWKVIKKLKIKFKKYIILYQPRSKLG
jgi:hypothetical protein